MQRIVISLLTGVAITMGMPIFAALVLYRGHSEAILPTFLYWPLLVTDKLGLGLDCANADLVSDKLTCLRTALLIDAVCYPLIFFVSSFIIHRILTRRGRHLVV
jgi:hypothetical protein